MHVCVGLGLGMLHKSVPFLQQCVRLFTLQEQTVTCLFLCLFVTVIIVHTLTPWQVTKRTVTDNVSSAVRLMWSWRHHTHPVLVQANRLQMLIVEQLLWVDVDWRLALSFTAQAPFGVDKPPKLWPWRRAQKTQMEFFSPKSDTLARRKIQDQCCGCQLQRSVMSGFCRLYS